MDIGTEKKKEKPTTRNSLKYFLGIGICLGAVLVMANSLFDSELSSTTDELVRIPLSELSEMTRWYEYNAGGHYSEILCCHSW
jgi:hypothetical protein